MSESIEIGLNNVPIPKIPFEKYKKDFTFIVDGQKYPVSRIEADLISPLIRNFHYTDESIETFEINTYNQFQRCRFSDFLSLLSNDHIKVELKSQYYFKFLFSLLGNNEESEKYSLKYDDSLSIDNVIERILQKETYYNSKDVIGDELNFCAQNFNQLSQKIKSQLDLEDIEKIITSDELQIEDEDYLLNFVIDLYQTNKNSSYLFDNIYFINISNEALNFFYTKFDINDLHQSTWDSIMDRLLNSRGSQCIEKRQYTNSNKPSQKLFEYSADSPFNGILKYLTDKTGGNIHDNGTISITASSTQYFAGQKFAKNCKNLVNYTDFHKSSMWSPANENNFSLIFDFKDRHVDLQAYTFHTPVENTKDYPRSWNVMVSVDGSHWRYSDVKHDVSEMNRCNTTQHFRCKNDHDNVGYRYIKITNNGPCWNGNNRYYFDISAVEFYGYLYEKSDI